MVGGVYRTDRFTGSIIAMLAKHGQEDGFFHAVGVMVTLYTQPCHFAPFDDTLFTDNADVVFRITGSGAGVAPDTSIEIHHHGPSIGIMIVGRIDVPFGIVSFWKRQRQGKRIHIQALLFPFAAGIQFSKRNR